MTVDMTVHRMVDKNQNTFKSHYRKFIENTTIHGFRDMFYATPKVVKFIWFVIVIVCISGAGYQISVMAMEFRDQPTTSRIFWSMRKSYNVPTITYCPTKWVNFTSATRMGLKNYTIMALKKAAFSIDDPIDEYTEKAMLNLDHVLKTRNTNLLRLFHDISHDWQKFLECRQCKKIVKHYQQNNGVCYQFHFPPLDSKRLTIASFMKLRFSYKDPTNNFTDEFNSFERMSEPAKLAIGEAAVSSVAFDSTLVKLNRDYQLKIHLKKIIKLNKVEDPCRRRLESQTDTFAFASADSCALNCSGYMSGAYYHFCILCSKMSTNLTNYLSITHPCAMDRWRAGNDSEKCERSRNETFDECSTSQRCYPPSCEFFLYDYSLNVLAEKRSNMTVHIFFRPIEGIETVKEVYTYSWETFMSNIGGQLGLWLGASVVSFFQIMYYCFHYCCTRNEIKRLASSRRRNSTSSQSTNSIRERFKPFNKTVFV